MNQGIIIVILFDIDYDLDIHKEVSQRFRFRVFLKTSVAVFEMLITRVCGMTHSISARRWVGDGFDARPKP